MNPAVTFRRILPPLVAALLTVPAATGQTLLPAYDLLKVPNSTADAPQVTAYGARVGDNMGSYMITGDLNGDGIQDWIVAAQSADIVPPAPAQTRPDAGAVYVWFGKAAFAGAKDVPGTAGAAPDIIIRGPSPGDQVGANGELLVADFNGDGTDDLCIGAHLADGPAEGRATCGEAYLIFGRSSPAVFPAALDLAVQGNGGADVTIYGGGTGDNLTDRGAMIAGDFNDDGVTDLALGAPEADGPGNTRERAGEACIIFGRAVFPATLDMAVAGAGGANVTIVGSQGTVSMISPPDYLTWDGAMAAGDLNGDGVDDLVLGANLWGPAVVPGNDIPSYGAVYVIFGRAAPASFPASLDMAVQGNGGADVTYRGATPHARLPANFDASHRGAGLAIGDFNGDGTSDLLMGATEGGGERRGEVFLILGRPVFPVEASLATPGVANAVITGENPDDLLSVVPRGVGDCNGDGVDDFVLTAFLADGLNESRFNCGQAYLVLGRPGPAAFPAQSVITSVAATTIYGATDRDELTAMGSVLTGDFNGDGRDDLLLGAVTADGPVNRFSCGAAYLVFGRPAYPRELDLGFPGNGGANVTIYGGRNLDGLTRLGAVGSGDVNGDGRLDLLLGAPDALHASSTLRTGRSYVIYGVTATGPQISVVRPDGSAAVDGGPAVSLGAAVPQTSGAPRVFTVQNYGTSALNVTSVTITGGHAADFALTPPALPASLAPGQQITFSVIFSPSVAGLRSTTLSILSNDADEGTFDFPLTGDGNSPPVLQLPASPLIVSAPGFNDVYVDFSADVTATDAEDEPDPVPVASPTSGSYFPPGDTTVNVTVTDSGGLTTNGSFIVRAIVPPEITVEQPAGTDLADYGSTVDFGLLNPGQNSAQFPFVIKNTGGTPLNVSGLTVSGSEAAEFVLTPPALPSVVAPGQSITANVRFSPAAGGPRSALLEITSNDDDENIFEIYLTGTGNTPPALQLPSSPLVVSASSATGANVAFTVTVTDSEQDPPPVPVVNPPSGSLFPIGDTTVNVSVTDNRGLTVADSFVVSVVVAPEIRVEQPAGTDLGVSPTVDFGIRNPGSTGPPVVITIRNTGIVPLTVTDVGVSDPSEFALTPPALPAVLAAGQTITCSVRFTPAAGGLRSTWLTITSDDADEGFIFVTLTGTGNTAPALNLPASPLIVTATSPAGATVSFDLSSTDAEQDPGPTPVAVPASGSLFPVGDTTVNVSATDSGGLTASDSFVVRIVPPGEIAVEQPAGTNLTDGAATVNFGLVNPGYSSAAATFTIKNTGTTDLTVSEITVTGGAAGDFFVWPPFLPAVIPPGQEITCDVTFTPGDGGPRSAVLHILNDDYNEGSFEITLTGTGNTPPELQLPAAPFVATATTAVGGIVNFTITAPDAEDAPDPVAVATPASGSSFPIGDTLVEVTVTDSDGLTATGSFTVRVEPGLAPRTLAYTGQPAPGTGQTFTWLGQPTLNASGRCVFGAGLSNGVEGTWSGTRAGVAMLAGDGAPVPGLGAGVFYGEIHSNAWNIPVNVSGQSVFGAAITGAGINSANNSVVCAGSPGNVAVIARAGSQAPGLPAGVVFSGLDLGHAVINAEGTCLFHAQVSGPGIIDGGNDDNSLALWTGDAGGLAVLARSGDPAPGTGPGVRFLYPDPSPAINATGQCVFTCGLTGTGVVTANSAGIWTGRPGQLTLVMRGGDPAPGTPPGITFISSGDPVVINAAGRLGFAAGLAGPGLNNINSLGIWVGTAGNLTLLARTGEPAPGASAGTVFHQLAAPMINSAGQFAFHADLSDGGINSSITGTGIWRGEPGDITKVVSSGDPAPGAGTGTVFKEIYNNAAFNDQGTVVFTATLQGPNVVPDGNDFSLWMASATSPPSLVARTGSSVEVTLGNSRTVLDLAFAGESFYSTSLGGSGDEDGRGCGLNDQGQIAFVAFFDGGSSAIFLTEPYTPPPPTPGQVDLLFDSGTAVANNTVRSAVPASDGKIYVAGSFATPVAVHDRIARLNSDGSPDASFDPVSGAGNASIDCVAVQTDGRVLLAGQFGSYGGTSRRNIARIHPDGSLDDSFDPGTGAFNTVSEGSVIHGLAVQADGRILIGGRFTSYDGTPRSHIARLHSDGSLDDSFDPGTGANEFVHSIAVQGDGKILIGGLFSSYNGTPRARIARLETNGSLDTSFDPGIGVNGLVNAIVVQPDGKVLIAGSFSSYNGTARLDIARIHPDGSNDASFTPRTTASRTIYSMALQADGKVMLAGGFPDYTGRINSNGTVDATFGTGNSTNANVLSAALTADGKVLLGGQFDIFDGRQQRHLARLLNGPATRSLTATSSTRVSWLRGGSAPELEQVTFDRSPDGVTWTPLGAATRIIGGGGWELTGLSLTGTGQIRARGRATGGQFNASSSIIQQTVAYSFPGGYSAMWRQQYFGSPDNTGNAADTADPDNDGLTNLMERALGLHPLQASQLPVQILQNGAVIEFTYTRSVAALADTEFRVEWSDDLAAGAWSILNDNGTTQTVRATVPAGTVRRFVHLRVTAAM